MQLCSVVLRAFLKSFDCRTAARYSKSAPTGFRLLGSIICFWSLRKVRFSAFQASSARLGSFQFSLVQLSLAELSTVELIPIQSASIQFVSFQLTFRFARIPNFSISRIFDFLFDRVQGEVRRQVLFFYHTVMCTSTFPDVASHTCPLRLHAFLKLSLLDIRRKLNSRIALQYMFSCVHGRLGG